MLKTVFTVMKIVIAVLVCVLRMPVVRDSVELGPLTHSLADYTAILLFVKRPAIIICPNDIAVVVVVIIVVVVVAVVVVVVIGCIPDFQRQTRHCFDNDECCTGVCNSYGDCGKDSIHSP